MHIMHSIIISSTLYTVFLSKKKVKNDGREAVIANFLALSQIPAEAARPWTRRQMSHGMPVLLQLMLTKVPNYTAS